MTRGASIKAPRWASFGFVCAVLVLALGVALAEFVVRDYANRLTSDVQQSERA